MSFVLDASVALAWCFPDEDSDYADRALGRLSNEVAIVPGIWALELSNALVVARRRARLTEAELAQARALLANLPIAPQLPALSIALGSVLDLAVDHNLTAYDAAYLELAMREGVPLASEDARLRAAAAAAGVPLVS